MFSFSNIASMAFSFKRSSLIKRNLFSCKFFNPLQQTPCLNLQDYPQLLHHNLHLKSSTFVWLAIKPAPPVTKIFIKHLISLIYYFSVCFLLNLSINVIKHTLNVIQNISHMFIHFSYNSLSHISSLYHRNNLIHVIIFVLTESSAK